ncbi:aminomethyl-transferring glycine dehydrogenase subunit GcvPA [bacterium]|nr:aminomethyl-transferring glycine dehydrogenase subunit GcvPA [bacterium]
MMRYFSLTEHDKKQMLDTLGKSSLEQLFLSLPEEVFHQGQLNLPSAKEEYELQSYFEAMSHKNYSAQKSFKSYLGAGAYEHFIPYVVDALSSRGEFTTAYTPYQAEISQGTLQAIFEFQSMVANLLGVGVANASMYDGASALAEAVLMALRIQKKRSKVLISQGVHPEYIKTIQSYIDPNQCEIHYLPLNQEGYPQLPELDDSIACVVTGYPNFYGVIEPIDQIAEQCKQHNILTIACFTEALAFGLLKAPGELGADIVVGEGQSLGNPLSFGGPYVGLMGADDKYVRQLPGRLAGQTVDAQGTPGYVLTLSTREQHIRRQKATSNICTNHSLCALRAAIYMGTLGQKGIESIALNNHEKAEYLKNELTQLKGLELLYQGPSFNEFAIKLNSISLKQWQEAFENNNIASGVDLARFDHRNKNCLLINCTETKTDDDLKHYIKVAKEVLK